MVNPEPLSRYRAECILAGILLLSGFLNLWNIWNQGFSNEYYAAAVRSTLTNPAVALYNSLDAVGFVTVDKPPVGLWVQAASAALLGYSGWALVLPQALAGVGSVLLVYLIVSRPFGKPAGLVSAFALAVTPIFVAVSRNGTMDGQLIFVLLLAVWASLKAARERSLPYLLLSVVFIGIGFNIKMIQAFIVVPAVLAVYLIGAKIPTGKRVVHLALAVVLLATVSLSWAVAVDMVPSDQRPYIGGSGDNTVLGLILDYNGMNRLAGGTMTAGDGSGLAPRSGGTAPGMPSGNLSSTGDGRTGPYADGAPPDQGQMPFSSGGGQTGPGAVRLSGGGGMDDTGTPGILRLFCQGLAGQLTWLLPFALIGLLALWRRPASLSAQGLGEVGLSSEKGLTLIAMALWLLPGLAYFSFTTGFWHTYYLATIAPPLAALVGIGAAAMYRHYLAAGAKGWLLVVAVPVTGLVQVMILLYDAEWSGILIPVLLCGTVAATAVLAWARWQKRDEGDGLRKAAALVAIGLLFVAPFVWACTPLLYGDGSTLPTAGPQASRGGPGVGPSNGPPDTGNGLSGLAAYLTSHSTGETYLAAVPSSNSGGADLIIETGKPVMVLGGFAGSDAILTVEKLEGLIRDGAVRYFLVPSSSGAGRMNAGNEELYSWIREHCTAIPSSEWGGGTTQFRNGAADQYTLYDCGRNGSLVSG